MKIFVLSRVGRLSLLAATALLSFGLAEAALRRQTADISSVRNPTPLFEDFSVQQNAATDIWVTTRSGRVHMNFLPSRGWVLADRSNYPVPFELVREILVSLGTMQRIEPKTAMTAWFSYVGIDDPSDGDGLEIAANDGRGTPLADVIVGKRVNRGDGRMAAFARKGAETQSWLVTSPFDLRAAFVGWFRTPLFGADMPRFAEISFYPVRHTPISLFRTTPQSAFQPRSAGSAWSSLLPRDAETLLASMTVQNAEPRLDMAFASRCPHVLLRSFDGLIYDIAIHRIGKAYWAKLIATAEAGPARTRGEDRLTNAKAYNWMFRVPDDLGKRLVGETITL